MLGSLVTPLALGARLLAGSNPAIPTGRGLPRTLAMRSPSRLIRPVNCLGILSGRAPVANGVDRRGNKGCAPARLPLSLLLALVAQWIVQRVSAPHVWVRFLPGAPRADNSVGRDMNRSEYDLDRYYRRRAKIIEHLGSSCVRCGTEDRLQVDHVDPYSKGYDVSACWWKPWDDTIQELKKCQLLCDDCHRAKCLVDGSTQKGRARGEQIKQSKLDAAKVTEIRRRAAGGESVSALARCFGVSRGNIRFIVNRNTWAHI